MSLNLFIVILLYVFLFTFIFKVILLIISVYQSPHLLMRTRPISDDLQRRRSSSNSGFFGLFTFVFQFSCSYVRYSVLIKQT